MNFYAEDQIDRLIREKFFPNYNYSGLLVEVGAGPSEFYSVSKHFRDSGWRCVGFDPNPKFVKQHRVLGNECYQLALADYVGQSEFTIVNTGSWSAADEGISYSALGIRYQCPHEDRTIITVNVDKLDNVLNQLGIKNIDILVIDVEGWELDVMRGLDTKKIRPKLIVLENYQYDNNYKIYMESIGYQLIDSVKYNFFFIPV